jgi:N-acetylmuramoyl-L-alanine amidase
MTLMVLISCFILSETALAEPCKTGECQYYKAEKSHKALLNDSKSKKRRDKWLTVIEEYKKVSEIEPKGSFAAVGLYKTGTLYKELYGLSKNKNDLANAREYFEKASAFKKSKVRFEAEQLLKSLPESKGKKNDDVKDDNPEKPEKQDKADKPDKRDKSGKADSAKNTSIDKENPKDRIKAKDKDKEKIGPGKKEEPSKELIEKKEPDEKKGKEDKKAGKKNTKADARIKPDPSFLPEAVKPVDVRKTVETPKKPGSGTHVKGLRFGSLPTRTRIVIDTDSTVSYKHGLLGKSETDPTVKLLYVDIKNSSLLNATKSDVCIDDERVKFLRASDKDHDTVRILVEIKTYKDYKVFALRNPSRVVIDVWGHSSSPAQEDERDQDEGDSPKTGTIIEASDLAKQFQLGVKRIVIDPGHGGQDAGAPGYEKGVFEKDVVLSIAKKLAEKVEKELGVEVIMTRSDDTFITLEERTQIANRKKADLFISIHTNATLNKSAYGIETYFLNLARDKDSVAVAARENATSEKNISDLQSILDSLMRNTKITESSKLATYVQDSMVRNLSKSYEQVNSKGVKQAPFYVLLGARMPAILVETSFISNERECKRLTDAEYQVKLCDAIVDGVRAYIRKTSPMKDSKRK